MSTLKIKGESLYQKLKASRESLVKKYEAAGSINYDEALGIAGPNHALTATVGATTYTLTKSVTFYDESVTRDPVTGVLSAPAGFTLTQLSQTATVPNLAQISAYNIARGAKDLNGVASGKMIDALRTFASGKVVKLDSGDEGLANGFIILEEVPCLLRIMTDIKPQHMAPSRATDTTLGLPASVVHSVPGKVENQAMRFRGNFKWLNYRNSVETLKDSISIWSLTDKSLQPMALFGPNSLIRMWGKDQIVDLQGFRISQHERPARFAGFQALIDLSDGHFAGLTSKSARNAHIYSSKGKGILGRSNHFAIRGHGVKGLLIEGITFGLKGFFNEGAYFGNMLNDADGVVLKDCHTEVVNKAVSLSSTGLVWYNQLQLNEVLFAKYETTTTFGTGTAYPWMKWENIAAGTPDTFGNGKTTAYPVIKTQAELVTAGVPSANAAAVLDALKAAEAAYHKSHKHADDMYIQVHTASGRNFLAAKSGTLMDDVAMIPRTTNGVVSNPKNADGFRYPDSTYYGFRVGSADEGVGKLAQARGGKVQDIVVMDSSFESAHLSLMEALALGLPSGGLAKGFNGFGLRPFGMTNSNSAAAGIASALVLMSKEVMEAASPGLKLEGKTVDQYDTAAKAVANYTGSSAWTAAKAHGLYKGNDVIEMSLATLEAIGLLRKYFTANTPTAVISGVDNSNVDIGLLALRKSMMVALSAKTASQIGLKGGYLSSAPAQAAGIFDAAQEMEIYPWVVSVDGSISKDKDTELSSQSLPSNSRSTSVGYFGALLPDLSDSIYKLKLVSKDTVALVTAGSESPVTYQMCADLLGFSKTSAGTPADMTAAVQYKLVRNVDGQNHTHKGAFGVRVDEASSVLIKNVVIRDIETSDAGKPVQALGSVAQQIAFGINAEQRPESGVLDAHGISLNGVTEAHVEDIIVGGVAGGSIFGVEVAGKSSEVTIENVEIETLEAGIGGELAQPFGEQKAIGVKIAKGCSEIKVSSVRAGELIAAHSGLAKVVEIEDANVELKK